MRSPPSPFRGRGGRRTARCWRSPAPPGAAGGKPTSAKRGDEKAPQVVTDADRLRRIMENLVENAVKYTPEGGAVEVKSGPGTDRGAVLEVRDNGPGIAAEHLPRIFERF